jgi:tetratricopeptide (TPR) repeat protein
VSLYDNKYVNTAYTLFKDIYEPSCKNIQEGYSYMALCCWDLKKWDECLHYLNLAIKLNPNEAKKVLIDLVPNDLNTSEYLIHIKSLIERFKNQDNDVN